MVAWAEGWAPDVSAAQRAYAIARTRTDPEYLQAMDRALADGTLALVEDGEKPQIIVGGSWPSRMPGGRRAVCSGCRTYVGLSADSGAAIADRFPDVPVVCYPCAIRMMEEEGNAQ